MDIPNMECEKHPGFTMTFVCMTCNATLVCMDCMTDNLHHGHMFCKPNTISTDIKANLTLKIDTDCRLEAALESDLNEMRTLKSQHENKQMETVTSINTQREILIKAVNEMADSFISQNETQNERNYVAIQDAIDDISGKLENVRQHRKDAIRILGETDELTMAQDSLKLTDVESQSKPFTGLTSVEFTHGKVINDQLKLMFGCTVTAAAGKELPALCGAHENDYLEIVPGDTDTDTASQMNEPAISLGAQEVVYDYDYLEFMSGDKDTASRMNEPAISLGAQEVVYDTISMSASSDVVGIVHHQEKRLVLQSSFKHSRFSYVSSMCNAADGKSWVKCHGGREITLLNKHGQGAKTVKLNYSVRGMTITNDNTMFVCGVEERDIKQVELSTDKINSVFSTGKLYPQYVCTTQNGDLYVTLVDKHDYHITAQSRRTLVRYSEKGQEKSRAQYDSRGDVLFVWPCRVRICNAGDVIGVRNDTGKQTNHLVLMNTENLTLRLRYLGNGKVVSGEKKFDITNNTKDTSYRLNDFIFDSFDNIITCEVTNRCVQLLSKYCIPLRSLLTTLACAPMTITMNGDELWLGFGDGTLKVYEYQ